MNEKLAPKNVSDEIIGQVELVINTELAKRCYPVQATVSKHEDRRGNAELRVSSPSFNTVPAIMKEIQIQNFSTSMSYREADGDEPEHLGIWIQVHASYRHWDGGSNGCGIFVFIGQVYETSYGDLKLHSTIE